MEGLAVYKSIFEKHLEAYLDKLQDVEKPLLEAVKYSVLDGGKRIRPALVFIGANFMGRTVDEVMPLALCVEFIHSYSLVHDDLPAIDNDDLRRGKPSTHKKFGESLAVLTGDALLNLAVEAGLSKEFADPRYINAVKYIFTNTGMQGMIGGQCLDIKKSKQTSKEELLKIYSLKTSCLLKCSLLAGAIASGARRDEQALLADFGDKLGVIFQIVDDILDKIGSEEDIGKRVGHDEVNYVDIVGMEQAKADIAELYRQANEILDQFGARAREMKELLFYVANRTK
ncbi:MAG: polyprenyl synthetase family protein [Clostridia bacterium]